MRIVLRIIQALAIAHPLLVGYITALPWPAIAGGIANPTNPIAFYGFNISYTTDAYRNEALKLMIREAGRVAGDLNLPETLPITQSNLVSVFIAPFGFASLEGCIGRISTEKYAYSVSTSNRFDILCVANWEGLCREYQNQSRLPSNQIDTNAAYHMAIQWLAAAHMDVNGLNRDCHIDIEINSYWNGFSEGQNLQSRTFVPIYDVMWRTITNKTDVFAYARGSEAMVELFTPTDTLLQMHVDDAKYNLREPIVFENLADLVGGSNILDLSKRRYLTNKPSSNTVISDFRNR